MKSLVITPRDASEMHFLQELFQKMGIGIATIQTGDLEDAGLLKMMNEADLSKQVSREAVFEALKSS